MLASLPVPEAFVTLNALVRGQRQTVSKLRGVDCRRPTRPRSFHMGSVLVLTKKTYSESKPNRQQPPRQGEQSQLHGRLS